MTTVFLDVETLGLDRCAPIWEFAALRIEDDGTESAREHFTIRHHRPDDLSHLPSSFITDYLRRYDPAKAVDPFEAAIRIVAITSGRPDIAGSNPAFDTERLELLLKRNGFEPDWHYHPVDVPMIAIGWLGARGELPARPWKSDKLSAACGINPDDYARHTAIGDVLWCRDWYNRMLGSEGAVW
jgi:hypothetical protein